MERHPSRKRCVPSGMKFESSAFLTINNKPKRKDDAMTFT